MSSAQQRRTRALRHALMMADPVAWSHIYECEIRPEPNEPWWVRLALTGRTQKEATK